MPLILGTNSIKDTGYDVANSCRFDDNAYMSQTWGSSGNRRTWTLSMWIKYSGLNNCRIFSIGDNVSNTILSFFFTSGDLRFEDVQSGDYTAHFRTDRVFRDPSAWYHIVLALDTTQGTASDRMKLYINGVQETSFSESTIPSENVETLMNHTTGAATIGARAVNQSGTEFNGYMAEVVVLDGTAASPTEFGEFDSDSPTIWKPKDVSGLTFGTNGFYLDFKDSSNLGNDANGGSDFSETNFAATDQATDTPTNSFCTFNPLINAKGGNLTLSEGNLKLDIGAEAWKSALGTIALNNGKWYWEAKCIDATWWHNNGVFSLDTGDINNTSNPMNQTGYSGFYNADGGETRIDNTVSTGDYGLFAANDILGFYLDCDNNQFTIYKNGSSHVSATNLGTGRTDLVPIAVYYFYSGKGEGEYNFGGCQSFTISSGNTDANGYGNFEYSPTIGGVNYYAINTKNLAEFG